MEKILYLEPDEEITSVVDRIGDVKEEQISLVVPRGATLFQSLVNLKILKKQTQKFNKEISIVTTDKIGRNLASQVGFRVFGSIEKSEPTPLPEAPREEKMSLSEIQYKKTPLQDAKEIKSEEPKMIPKIPDTTKPTKSKKILYKYLIVIGIIIVFAAAFVMFLFLPKAIVTIAIKSEALKHSLDLTVDKNKDQVNTDNQIIPGKLIEVIKEGNKKQITTGKKDVGEKAKGTITIYNYWDSNPQPLTAGTRFQSNSTGRIFKSTIAVTVPGTTVEAGEIVPGTASVSVQAEENGEAYNIGPDTFKIPGLSAEKQAKIYGKSTQAFSGGTKKEITVVAQKDIDVLSTALFTELSQKAKQDLDEQKEGYELQDKAIEIKIVESGANPQVNAEASEVTVSMKVEARAIIYKKSDLITLIEKDLQGEIKEDKVLVTRNEDIKTLNYDITSLDFEDGQMKMSVEVEVKIAPKVDENKLRQNVMGKKSQEAQDYLATFPEVEYTKIDLWPFWVKKVPNIRDRIKIQVNYNTTTQDNEDEKKKEEG